MLLGIAVAHGRAILIFVDVPRQLITSHNMGLIVEERWHIELLVRYAAPRRDLNRCISIENDLQYVG